MTTAEDESSSKILLIQASVVVLLLVGLQVAMARFAIDQEAKRRWQHGVTGHAFVTVSYILPTNLCIYALLAGAIGMYYVRFYQTDFFLQAFGPLLRSHEKESNRLPGAFYFLLGTAITTSLFPINVARYAVECLALADPMAAWVGKSIQSPKLNDSSSIAGCLACFVTASLVGFAYLESMFQILAGSAACTLVEALSFANDNLLIPIATAAAASFALR